MEGTKQRRNKGTKEVPQTPCKMHGAKLQGSSPKVLHLPCQMQGSTGSMPKMLQMPCKMQGSSPKRL